MNPHPQPSEWGTAVEVWDALCAHHPELAQRPGRWPFYNFMRRFKAPLVAADALRKCNGRHWIAHRKRFVAVAFECLTAAEAVN